MDSQKLKIKDIITITLLALINVILFMFSSLLYVTPVTTLLMPVIYSLIEGIVFFTINVKVQKRGAAFLYCLIRGILGGYLPYIICYVVAGIIAEIVIGKMGYGKASGMTISYIIIEVLAAVGGTFYPYVIAYDSFFSAIDTSDDKSRNVLDAANMIHSWGSILLLAGIVIASFAGALIAKRIVRKHLAEA